jgi:hypothetical protein
LTPIRFEKHWDPCFEHNSCSTQYPTLELSLFSKIPQVHDKGKWKLIDEHDVES